MRYTDFNLGQSGSLLLEARLEDLFLRLNESIELSLDFLLLPGVMPSEELGFEVSTAFANSGMNELVPAIIRSVMFHLHVRVKKLCLERGSNHY